MRDGYDNGVLIVPVRSDPHADSGGADPKARTWLRELPRWLAALNPGRTPREYERAVRYFFETPGVPAEMTALSFDLLLAYRGALALRATAPRDRAAADRPRARAAAAARADVAGRSLPGNTPDAGPRAFGDEELVGEQAEEQTEGTAPSQGPLAPATVNIRLTALRQFLVWCALGDALPQLTPDHIRAALRRLSIERRRPYQILAEPEWEQFLQAAQLPLLAPPAAGRGPWGVTQAERREGSPAQPPNLPRSRAGLTGARTARRDHALIALALATGLRAVELSELDVGDLTREWHAGKEEWWLVLPDAKTKGQRGGRTLPLAPPLVETLHTYLASTGRSWERAADRRTPLFPSMARQKTSGVRARASGDEIDALGQRARRLTPTQIRYIVDRVEIQWLALRGQSAGQSDTSMLEGDHTAAETRSISPHALRHSTAVALLEGNDATGRPPASVEHVRGWLGHFDIRTTQGYLAHLEARHHRRPFALSPMSESQPPQPMPSMGEMPPPDHQGRSVGPDDADPESSNS